MATSLTKYSSLNIFITPKLKESLSAENYNHLDRNIIYLLRFIEQWGNRAVLECNSEDKDFISKETTSDYSKRDIIFDRLLYKSKYPVILGTKEEVIERRINFKGLQGNICYSKIELINQITSSNVCENFGRIYEELIKLQSLCELHDRYAYYVPKKCVSQIISYPLSSNVNPNMDLDVCIKPLDAVTLESGYIMMPYDIDRLFSFTPKFYQALCHEMFHAQVIDRYRGSKSINEGLPEIYSEFCYYQFIEEFIEDYFGNAEMFKPDYMKFQNTGSYKTYYLFVKKQLGFENENQIKDGFHDFNTFICELLYLSKEQMMSKYDKTFLDCKEETPYWQYVFERACDNLHYANRYRV